MIIINQTDHNVNLPKDLPVSRSIEGKWMISCTIHRSFDCPWSIALPPFIAPSIDAGRSIDIEFESFHWYSLPSGLNGLSGSCTVKDTIGRKILILYWILHGSPYFFSHSSTRSISTYCCVTVPHPWRMVHKTLCMMIIGAWLHYGFDRKRHEVKRTEICGVPSSKTQGKPTACWENPEKIMRKILRSYLCSLGMSIFMVLVRR